MVGLQVGSDFPSWRPGQFLSLRKLINGKTIIRSYSICSLPTEGLQLLVRREANGVFSRWLADYARPSDMLESLGPTGSFVLPDTLAPIDTLVLFAAGSGIAPIRPLALKAVDERGNAFASKVHLLYSEYSVETALFLEEFTTLAQAKPDFLFTPFLSQTGTVKANRLNNLLLEEYLAAHQITPGKTNLFFLCGPISYRRMVRFTLRTMGFSADEIREENFDLLDTPPQKRPLLQTDALIKVTLQTGIEAQFLCKPHETILAAGLRNGVDMPYSCRGGVCSSCTARLVSGKTLMTINEVLAPDDLARNLTLTCTALPATEEIELKFGAEI